MTSLDLVDGRRGLWDVVDVILLLVTIPMDIWVWSGLSFSFWFVWFWAMVVCFLTCVGIVFRGKCYMNTLPFARIGIWGFSFLSLFLCLFAYIMFRGSRSSGPRG